MCSVGVLVAILPLSRFSAKCGSNQSGHLSVLSLRGSTSNLRSLGAGVKHGSIVLPNRAILLFVLKS